MKHIYRAFVVTLTALLLGSSLPGAASAASTSSLPSACRGYSGKMICISKAHYRIYLVRNGKILSSASIRYGEPSKYASDHTKGYFTREGLFHIGYKRGKNATSNLYSTATGLPIKMPYFMQFSGGQGIHYSAEFAQTGYRWSSHGCVNLRSMTFARNANSFAYVGMPVVVTRH